MWTNQVYLNFNNCFYVWKLSEASLSLIYHIHYFNGVIHIFMQVRITSHGCIGDIKFENLSYL